MRSSISQQRWSRRKFLALAGSAAALASRPAWAQANVHLGFPGGVDQRPLVSDFPHKGAMILQRSRPPLLETPFEVFDQGVFTPNDRFYVRWHWAVIPTEVDADTFRLAVRGHVNQALSLSLTDILALPRVEMAAVNQCSGNSRGFFSRGSPAANGRTARWAMPSGPACGSRTCSTARA